MTQRVVDANGWYEVKRNPLSRVGVFPYTGRSVGLTGKDADRVVMVLRPEEELSDPECVASFKLLPWVDEHTMLGPEDAGNVTPAEVKGVHGVIGEAVEFSKKDGVLYGNIKAFSNSLGRLIEAGKRQLSCGYRCVYDFTSGVWNGQPYDAVQRKIRGNHLALVGEGRMGPSVAVMDSLVFTFDAQEAVYMPDPNNPNPQPGGTPQPGGEDPTNNPAARLTIAEVGDLMKAVVPMLKGIQTALAGLGGGGGGGLPQPGGDPTENADPKNPRPNLDPKPAPKAEGGADPSNPQPKEPNPEEEHAMDEALKKQVADLSTTVETLGKTVATAVAAMDSAIKGLPTAQTIAQDTAARDKLAERLSAVVGTFDAKEMTLQGVAKYGVEKLELKDVADGAEVVAVSAYLTAAEKQPTTTVRLKGAGMDAAPSGDNFVTRHLAGKAAQ